MCKSHCVHVAKPVHRLGDERVLSVDLDTSPVDLARKFLAMISRDPLLEQASEPVLLRRDARTVSNGMWPVIERGPIRLWRAVEEARRGWRSAGEPGWSRLGLTVTPSEQWGWIDDPHGEHRWRLS